MRTVDNECPIASREDVAIMRHSESELERVIAAARGIPTPPHLPDAPPGHRLAAAAHWLRFWHARTVTASGPGAERAERAGRAADS